MVQNPNPESTNQSTNDQPANDQPANDQPANDQSTSNFEIEIHTEDMVNSESEYKVELSVGDFKRGELQVKLLRGIFIVVQGRNETKKGAEVIINKFTSTFELPFGVRSRDMKVKLSGGILIISAPKFKFPVDIPIESGDL